LAILGRKSAAHQVPQRAPHAFFFEQVIGQMLEQIVGGGEENLLRAIPLSVAMDSHLKLTIAQLIWLSNPNLRFRRVTTRRGGALEIRSQFI
jgi:hypothetical protein